MSASRIIKPPAGTPLRGGALTQNLMAFSAFQDQTYFTTVINQAWPAFHTLTTPHISANELSRGFHTALGLTVFSGSAGGAYTIANPGRFGNATDPHSYYVRMVYTSTPSGDHSILTLAQAASATAGMQLSNNSGVFHATRWGGATIVSGSTAVAGTLYALVISFDGTTVRYYENGIEIGSSTSNLPTSGAIDAAYLSTYNGNRGTGEPILNGHVGAFGIWNRALTQAEVRELWLDPNAVYVQTKRRGVKIQTAAPPGTAFPDHFYRQMYAA